MEKELEAFYKFVSNLLEKEVSYKLEVEPGRKFIKLISVRGVDSRSVWCFVNKETGEIFKPACWARPAKHARGNIKDVTTYSSYSWTGPHYLR